MKESRTDDHCPQKFLQRVSYMKLGKHSKQNHGLYSPGCQVWTKNEKNDTGDTLGLVSRTQ